MAIARMRGSAAWTNLGAIAALGLANMGLSSMAWAQHETSPKNVAAEHIRDAALRPTTPIAGSGFEDLKGLKEMIGDARIVALGESTHGTRECFQMKHRLLEYLVEEMGFSIFAMEANMPEAYALSDYVIDGKGDPKKLIDGIYFLVWNTQEVLDMVEWMRAWNVKNPPESGKPRLQFTGFDMQTPDVAWKVASDFIDASAPDLKPAQDSLLKDVKAVAAAASMGRVAPGWTSMGGMFPHEPAKGKKLTFSVWIKTQGVTGWAGGWMRCETPGGDGPIVNMEDLGIKGDTEWALHELSMDVPADTNGILFGFIHNGDGVAWFDDIEMTIDGKKYEDPAKFSFDFENDDVKFLTGGSGEYAIKRTEEQAHSGKKSLEMRRRPESEVPKVDPEEVATRATKVYEDLLARREELVKTHDAKAVDWAIQNARVVSQSAAMHGSPYGFNVREASMAANIGWILDQNPGRKIVVWAHNAHVSRGGFMGMQSMGQLLAETRGKEMVSVGFATGTGTYSATKPGDRVQSENPLATPPEDSVEAVFMRSGLPMAIVDIRSAQAAEDTLAWAATQRPMRSIGGLATEQQFFPAVAREKFDVLVWQRETTGSRAME